MTVKHHVGTKTEKTTRTLTARSSWYSCSRYRTHTGIFSFGWQRTTLHMGTRVIQRMKLCMSALILVDKNRRANGQHSSPYSTQRDTTRHDRLKIKILSSYRRGVFFDFQVMPKYVRTVNIGVWTVYRGFSGRSAPPRIISIIVIGAEKNTPRRQWRPTFRGAAANDFR